MTTLLTTLKDFHIARGSTYDPTDEAAIIALEAASELVRRYTGRSFAYTEDEEITLDGTGTDALLLPNPPVEEVSEVAVVDWNDDETLLETTDYRLDPDAGILWRLHRAWWPYPRTWERQSIRIVYTHGYQEVPSDVQQAVRSIAGRHLDRNTVLTSTDTPTGAVSALQIGGYRVSYDTDGGSSSQSEDSNGLIPYEVGVLDRYRIGRLA